LKVSTGVQLAFAFFTKLRVPAKIQVLTVGTSFAIEEPLGGSAFIFFGGAVLGGLAAIWNRDERIGAAIWFLMEGILFVWLLRRISEDAARSCRTWILISVWAFLLSFFLLGCAVFLFPLQIDGLLFAGLPAVLCMLALRKASRSVATHPGLAPTPRSEAAAEPAVQA
jgi:hypothetical protein